MTFQMLSPQPPKCFLSSKSGGEQNAHLIWSRWLICNLLLGCVLKNGLLFRGLSLPHSAHRQPSQQCQSVLRRTSATCWTEFTGDIDDFVILAARDRSCCEKTLTKDTKIDVLIDVPRQQLQSCNNRSASKNSNWGCNVNFLQWAADDFHCGLILIHAFRKETTNMLTSK